MDWRNVQRRLTRQVKELTVLSADATATKAKDSDGLASFVSYLSAARQNLHDASVRAGEVASAEEGQTGSK